MQFRTCLHFWRECVHSAYIPRTFADYSHAEISLPPASSVLPASDTDSLSCTLRQLLPHVHHMHIYYTIFGQKSQGFLKKSTHTRASCCCKGKTPAFHQKKQKHRQPLQLPVLPSIWEIEEYEDSLDNMMMNQKPHWLPEEEPPTAVPPESVPPYAAS